MMMSARLFLTVIVIGFTQLSACSTQIVGEIVPKGPSWRHLFVSINTSTATSLGGRAPYDQLCKTWASGAGLKGDYVALLSTTNLSAKDLLQYDVPIYQVDSSSARILVATDNADLWDGSVANRVRYTEVGLIAGSPADIGTGTSTDGKVSDNCEDFSQTTGDLARGHTEFTNSRWIAGPTSQPCSIGMLHLMCITSDQSETPQGGVID